MKIALITGASRGIGKSIAIQLAKENYLVIINYKQNHDKANETLKEILNLNLLAELYQCDVSIKKDVDIMISYIIDKYKKIDVLINNAGIADYKLFNDINENDWNNMFFQNINSVYNCTNAVINNMIYNKYGKIINISSIWGICGSAMEVHYSSTKAAIIGFTKALAKEVAPSNINVNAIACGVIDTDMLNDFTQEEINNLIEQTPLNRLGTPDDVANVVSFLVNDKSNFITGEVINVSGGFLI